jgi:hypothetical protein
MNAVEFPGVNVALGKSQPEYKTLPAMHLDGPQGEMITCFEMTEEELETVKKTRRIYVSQLTFNQPFQPVHVMASLDDGISLTHLQGESVL